MSSVEIVAFNKKGEAYYVGEVNNAWRGCMSIWKELERKYLKPIRPAQKIGEHNYVPSRLDAYGVSETEERELWDLWKRNDVLLEEKITLLSTYDYALVKEENLDRLLDAFRRCSHKGNNLNKQIELIETIDRNSIIAIGWNQISINENRWLFDKYDEEKDEYIPYNCLENDNHFWIFDCIDTENKNLRYLLI